MNLPNEVFLQNRKYRITGTIGQGGFGITYLAVWNTEVKGGLGAMKTEVPVCIKEYFFKDYCYRDEHSFQIKIHSKTGAELFDKFKEKLIKEANILSEVHHPYIVNVLEVFEENNTAYIVMEYITGCSLKYMLDHEGTLPENKVLKYVHQIGNALEFVHEKNIVHLDIKPSNIIIDKDDNARLIDFGVSKRYDIEQSDTSTTTLTLSKGFAAIEQYDEEGTQNFSPCPDIYSLGATMYNLLTGIIPVESILRITKEILPPTAYNSNISPKTEKAILKAMELKPENRFQTIREMLASLDTPTYELTENLLVETKNPFAENGKTESGDPSSKPQDEEDRTIPLVALASSSGTTTGMRRRRRRKKRRNTRRTILSIVAILLCAVVGYGLYTYFTGGNWSPKQYFSSQNAKDTVPASDNPANTAIPADNKPSTTESQTSTENNGTENTTGNDNSAVKTSEVKDNGENVQTSQTANTGKNDGIISYAEQETARKESEYQKFYASAQNNVQNKKFEEAKSDIEKALERKYTQDASSLQKMINEKLDEKALEDAFAQYKIMGEFGSLKIVMRKDNNRFGALDQKGKEKIPCLYMTFDPVDDELMGFQREEDNLYDLYNRMGERKSTGLPLK
ncbi:MAG: serine/threonine protein kinase [Tannerella sp.]|jgi:serine/threonine-protein kinase|nr:serine/threonine protein kinase [Tannerella sp.]